MKIKKLLESKLIEDVVDPDSHAEIVDEVQDQIDLSQEDTKELAQDISKDADAVSAESVVIAIDPDKDYEDVEIKNDITEALDEALEAAKSFIANGEDDTANVLIEGLPGSGKTAIVKNWCLRHGLTLVSFNATDPKIESAINGIPLRDVSAADSNAITYAYAKDKLGYLLQEVHPELKGKCVLFVDEVNRQKSQQLRRPFMSLFNEKRNSDGTLDFSENLLFSVVCINPYGDEFHDPGVGELVPAEKNRFLIKKQFDSNKDSSMAFFNGWIKNVLLDLGIIPPGSTASANHNGFVGPVKELSKDDLERAKNYIKRYELAMTILNDYNFRFDERGDANQIWLERADYLTSRLLTNAIAKTKGNPKSFLKWVDNDSGLSKRVKDMFHEILDGYIMDEAKLWKEFGLEKDDIAAVDANKANASANNNSAEDDDEDFEDDDVAAAGNKVGTGSTTSTDAEIDAIMKNWVL